MGRTWQILVAGQVSASLLRAPKCSGSELSLAAEGLHSGGKRSVARPWPPSPEV